MTELATKSAITMKGSAKMIQQFFHFGIHSILYQRGIYPSDSFTRFILLCCLVKNHTQKTLPYSEKKYGMTLLVNNDPKVHKFLQPLLEHVEV